MNDRPNRFDTAKHVAGEAASAVRVWAAAHPRAAKLTWFAIGLLATALFVWWLLPTRSYDMPRGMGGPQPVNVAVAAKAPIAVTVNALGTVTPLATASVRPQVSGQIVRFAFREGQMVQAGDVLAEIDSRSFDAQLAQARGQLARDVASLENARITYDRLLALKAAGATSQQNLDNQRAAVKQYEGTVAADRGTVKAAEINFGYTKVLSPITGRAGIRQVDVGNFVSAGQSTAIVAVTQQQPISVLFTVSEARVAEIMSRFNAGDAMMVEAYDRGQTVKLATGRLSAIDSQIDTATGTVKMRALFDNEDGTLFPNQFVYVRLLVATLQNQIVVPATAIQRGAGGTFVFVVKNDPDDKSKKTATMRAITPGVQDGNMVAVTAGLAVGETVVTDGGDRLRDGGQVTIPDGRKVADVKAPEAAGASAIPSDAERKAQRAKMRAACDGDIKKYCGGLEGRAVMMCMRDHRDDLSDACRAEMKKMRRGGGSGGPPGGPGGGPPPG